jgi:hypothetical protein
MSEGDITDADFFAAFERTAREADGRLIYLYLQKQLCAVTAANTDDCALRRNEGRRSFASELMGLMAKGIEESGGSRPDRQPVVFARREPVATGSRVSPREWLKQHPDADPTDRRPE